MSAGMRTCALSKEAKIRPSSCLRDDCRLMQVRNTEVQVGGYYQNDMREIALPAPESSDTELKGVPEPQSPSTFCYTMKTGRVLVE